MSSRRSSSRSPARVGRSESRRSIDAPDQEISKMHKMSRYWAVGSFVLLACIIFIKYKLKYPLDYLSHPTHLKTLGLPPIYRLNTWYTRGRGDLLTVFLCFLWASSVTHVLETISSCLRFDDNLDGYLKLRYGVTQILLHLLTFAACIFILRLTPSGAEEVLHGFPEGALPYSVKWLYMVQLGYWLSCIPMAFIYQSGRGVDKKEVFNFIMESIVMACILSFSYMIPMLTCAMLYPLMYHVIVRAIFRMIELLATWNVSRDLLYLVNGLHHSLWLGEKGLWVAYNCYLTIMSISISSLSFRILIAVVVVAAIAVELMIKYMAHTDGSAMHPGGFRAGFLGFPRYEELRTSASRTRSNSRFSR